MSTAVETKKDKAIAPVEQVTSKDILIRDLVLVGDLGRFSPDQKVAFYNELCSALDLNPVTRPFEFMVLQGKTVLYAKKDATEQLRKKFGISVVDMTKEMQGDLYVVTVKVQDSTGRVDIATGALDVSGKKGNELANLMMKCETKAKRRATLSISGLGIMDETELDTVPDSAPLKNVESKPHGHIEPAKKAIAESKTMADIDKIKGRLEKSLWTEQEELELDDALKNAEQRIKEAK